MSNFSIVNLNKMIFESKYSEALLHTYLWPLAMPSLPHPTPVLNTILESQETPLLFPVAWQYKGTRWDISAGVAEAAFLPYFACTPN